MNEVFSIFEIATFGEIRFEKLIVNKKFNIFKLDR